GRPPRRAPAAKAGAALALVAVVLAANGGGAADPAPVTVYLVPGPPGEPDKASVLVPPEFLERLRPPAPAEPRGVFVTEAVYDGSVTGDAAAFKATFQVYATTDEPSLLRLPLAGAVLDGDVGLDGARANPVALAGKETGVGLRVKGRGRHKVELHFRAAV